LLEGNDRIPLFHGKKQQKLPIQSHRRPKMTPQLIDLIVVLREFRYAAEQRNLAADQRN
jgi:hypothetical protein